MAAIRLPDGFVDELKARLKPSDVIGRKVKLKKQGKEWVGLSPFTNEKTPSFYVNDQKGIFKCFSSGVGGDIISFVQETERLSFIEAVEKLAEDAGMEIPKATPQEQEVYNRRQRLQAVCEAATVFYEDRLHASEGAEARAYLEGRGLGPTAWKRHRLGYAPDDWRKTIEHLKSQGFSQAEIVDAGLAVVKEGGKDPYDRFRGRVIFPILDVRGVPIAFGGRGMEPDAKPKYLNSSDTDLFHKGQVLYRFKVAREALGRGEDGGLIVCEGYMDAIALAEAGFGQAVAPLGTALTEQQLSLLWRAGPEPVMCFDGDAAGVRAAFKVIDRALPFLEPGRSLFFAMLPDGMDPDDVIRQSGKQAMAAELDASLPLVELLWRRERDVDPIDTPERKAGLEARLKAAAASIQHPGVRNAYERDLRQRMNDYFWQSRRKGQGQSNTGDAGSSGPLSARGRREGRGLGLLVRAIDSPALLDRCAEALAEAPFPDQDVAAICHSALDLIHADKTVDREAVTSHLEDAGKSRAVMLLKDYPKAPSLDPDEIEGREWLIALEQFAAAGRTSDEGGFEAEDDATGSASAWRRHHQKVAERRALRARVNEAAEQTDNS